MRRSPGLRGSARRSSFISGASKCKSGTKRNAVVRVRKIKSLAFHLPFSGQLSIGEELTDGQELVENSGSFGGGRKRDRTSDLGLVRAALSQLSYPPVPVLAAPASCTRRVTADDTRRVPKRARELAGDVLGWNLEGARDAAVADRVGGEAGDRLAAESDRARGRGEGAGDAVEARRLARAVRADETEDLALADLEGDGVQRREAAEALAQAGDRAHPARARPDRSRRVSGSRVAARR